MVTRFFRLDFVSSLEAPTARGIVGRAAQLLHIVLVCSAVGTPCWAVDCYDYASHLPTLGSADTPGEAQDVVVVGDYAYVADGDAGLAILRISNPGAPVLVATVDTPGVARGVAVSGELAVLADWVNGIVVIDISDPYAPFILGSIDTPGEALAVLFGNALDRVSVADGVAGVVIVDLQDPTSPAILGSVDTPGSAGDLVLFGDDYLFVADWDGGVQVISVSDPQNPEIVASTYIFGQVRGVDIQGHLLYAAVSGISSLYVLDIIDPLAPFIFGQLRDPYGGDGVEVHGDYAYLYTGSLVVVDVSPGQLRVVEASLEPVSGMVAVGNFLYIVSGVSGLRIVAIQSPESPLLGTALNSSGRGSVVCVATVGSWAFVIKSDVVGQFYDGLYVIEANPSLKVHGSISMETTGVTDLLVADGLLYAISQEGQIVETPGLLNVFDVNNPPNPVLLGRKALTRNPRAAALSGSTLFVAAADDGLLAVDMSDPSSPSIVASLVLPESAQDVDVNGSIAAVMGSASVFMVDVADLSTMAIIGQVDTPGEGMGIRIRDPHAYAAVGTAGLSVIDISDPKNPMLIGQTDTPGFARNVTLSGSFANVADAEAGLRVIDIQDPNAPHDIGGTYPGFGRFFKFLRRGSGFQVATAHSADGGALPDVVCLAAGLGGLRLYPAQCDLVTPIAITNLTALASHSGIALRCQIHVELAELVLQRATSGDGEFVTLLSTPAPPRPEGEWEFLDASVVPGGRYSYRVLARFTNGDIETVGPVQVVASPPAFAETRLVVTPNPAQNQVRVEVMSSGVRQHAVLVYDVTGRCVRRLPLAPTPAGTQGLSWDGRDTAGRLLARGTYYVQVEGSSTTARLTWLP